MHIFLGKLSGTGIYDVSNVIILLHFNEIRDLDRITKIYVNRSLLIL